MFLVFKKCHNIVQAGEDIERKVEEMGSSKYVMLKLKKI
jgi:hypothetical protein